MKLLAFCLVIFAAQAQISPVEDVVRLPPRQLSIRIDDGGKMVELIHAAPIISLPKEPPHVRIEGAAWYVDVRNLGPGDVELEGKGGLDIHLRPKETVRVGVTGDTYSVIRR